MKVNYIIVQAGGKGTRMQQLTYNKPKALVPINNLPMLFHLFQKYPDKKYRIIGDYKYEVLDKYLNAFAEVEYELIDARGKSGTCAGIDDALQIIPDNEAFMLIWSDLILPKEYEMPKNEKNYVGLSKDFRCRWRYENDSFQENPSEEYGVAGHFIFKNKMELAEVPKEGEFVKWLQSQKKSFEPIALHKTKEYGLIEEVNKLGKARCRPFNRITVEGDCIIKEGIDEQGRKLAVREIAWYQKIKEQKFTNIPVIYDTSPLKMEKIDGKNIYEYDLNFKQKKEVLSQLISCIRDIHELETCEVDRESYYEAYIGKTFQRLQKVYDLVPFAKEKVIKINGVECKNVFYNKEALEMLVEKYIPSEFRLLHGDCTFSNMLLKKGKVPVMIDPRGYFGFTELYGDPAYDWVKLYYSIIGNYDQFNLKKFILRIEPDEVQLQIESNHWEEMEDTFFELLEGEVTNEQMKVLHAIVWLSLTTYAWEDYDSICGAFYKGIELLNEVI